MAIIVGAYAAAPKPIRSLQLRSYVERVLAHPDIGGLEIPYLGPVSPWRNPDYLDASSPSSTHVVTLIPAMIGGLSATPTLGLGSADESAREMAIEIVRDALEFVASVNDRGLGTVIGIELHTSPPRPIASSEAFRRSLDEISTWNWADVRLTIEHCDAHTERHQPAKGFFTLEEEIAIARQFDIGIVINWGRSVIESRHPDGARRHIMKAASAGRLDGVIFSGVSPVETAYGPAWGDLHLPIRGWSDSTALTSPSASSLLTPEEVADCVSDARAATVSPFLGLKVSAPEAATFDQRVELVHANAAIVARAARRGDAQASRASD